MKENKSHMPAESLTAPPARSFYETVAADYENIFPLNRAFLELLQALVPAGARVLDLACGPGHYVRELEKKYQMTGCDICEPMIREARKISSAEFHPWGFADIAKLTPGFDGIYCIGNSLSYLPNPDLPSFLSTVKHLLAPDGIFIAHTVNWDAYLKTGSMDFQDVILPDGRLFKRFYEATPAGYVLFHLSLYTGETKERPSSGRGSESRSRGTTTGLFGSTGRNGSPRKSNAVTEQSWTDILYPKPAGLFIEAARKAGLQIKKHLGSYRQDPFDPETSPVSICILEK